MQATSFLPGQFHFPQRLGRTWIDCRVTSSCVQAYPAKVETSETYNGGPIGVIVCKQSMHRDASNRGYIAMLSVDKGWRKRGIGELISSYLCGTSLIRFPVHGAGL